MASLVRFVDALNKYLITILGVMLALMSTVIIFQITSRFFLGISLPWSEELARYLMAYGIFIGAALALRYQQLIAVEFLAERMSKQNRTRLKIVIHVVAIIFFVILFIKGIEMMERVNSQMSASLQIPMSIPYASVPIGAILLTINAIAVIAEMYSGKESENQWRQSS